MLSKFVILAVAVILATPIYAGTGGGSSGGGSSTGVGAGAGGHSSGGGGGGGGHGGGANGSGGRGGGLSGRAAAVTARSGVNGHNPSAPAGISRPDAMHATHLADRKLSEGEHHPYRREPNYGNYGKSVSEDDVYAKSWFNCFGPTKSLPGHKS
jgi:hypothetical protein